MNREAIITTLSQHIDPDLYAYVVCNCGEQYHTSKKFVEHLADQLVKGQQYVALDAIRDLGSDEIPFRREVFKTWHEERLRMSHISSEVDDIVTPDEERAVRPYPCIECGELWPCATIKELDRQKAVENFAHNFARITES